MKKILISLIVEAIASLTMVTSDIVVPRLSLNHFYNLNLAINETYNYSFSTSTNYYYRIIFENNSDVAVSIVSDSTTWTKTGIDPDLSFQSTNSSVAVSITNLSNRNVCFTIRKMRFTMYGYDYGSLNTTPDLTTPYNVFSPLIESHMYTDPINNCASHILGNDNRGLKRIDSDLFFYSYHGNNGYIYCPDLGGVDATHINTLHTSRISVFATCLTANQHDDGFESLPSAMITHGGKASLGWTKSILSSNSRTFTNKLFTELANGQTIGQATSAARNQFLFGNIRSCIIFGDSSTKVIDDIGVPHQACSQEYITWDSFTADLNEEIYCLETDEYGIRLYLSIDGYKTNGICDFELIDDEYVLVYKTENFDEIKRKIETSEYNEFRYENAKDIIETYENDYYEIFYLCIDNTMTPCVFFSETVSSDFGYSENLYAYDLISLNKIDIERYNLIS